MATPAITENAEVPEASASHFERAIARDRWIVSFGLAAVVTIAWIYLVSVAAGMHSMADQAAMASMGMPEMGSWGFREGVALFVMWAVMMVGMMLPSAAPMILLVLRVYRRRGDSRSRLHGFLFVGGYLLAWAAFSAVAAALQILLHRAALLTPEMVAHSAIFAAAILLVAGVYQWLPAKDACLAHCRAPLASLTKHWREGTWGALEMGAHHGLFGVGCCWALMALLFAVGVMNLLWVALIAAFVLAEKIAPPALRLSRLAGSLLILCAVYALSRGL
jgi:predicted metal-binding membrane protein